MGCGSSNHGTQAAAPAASSATTDSKTGTGSTAPTDTAHAAAADKAVAPASAPAPAAAGAANGTSKVNSFEVLQQLATENGDKRDYKGIKLLSDVFKDRTAAKAA